jgi:hypothetical protein
MNAQVGPLIVLQEIDALLEEATREDWAERERSLGFAVGNLETVRERRQALSGAIEERALGRYADARRHHARAVVPQRSGVCLGCFTVRPTAAAARAAGLETCERCGRLLFRLEEAPAPELRAAIPKRSPSRPAPRKRKARQASSSTRAADPSSSRPGLRDP